jgi:3D (Asp-Asp-Asp) domain-containing protein
LRQHVQALDARAHRALLSLYSIETQLGYARDRLASLDRETTRVRAQQTTARQQVSITRHALAVSRRQLADRLRLMYERGDPDALAVLLGAQSLEDAISTLEDLARTNRQNHAAIDQTKTTERSLARHLKILARRSARLASLTTLAQATASSLTVAHAQRARLLTSLRTQARLDREKIAALVATARAAEARSKKLAPPVIRVTAPQVPVTPSAPDDSSRLSVPASADAPQTITVVATGYSLDGRTSTGLPVGWGIVAVDPAVIPLGTRLSIPGYGDAVAADVGSGVKGATIDLWFPTLSEALAWGRREVTITLG